MATGRPGTAAADVYCRLHVVAILQARGSAPNTGAAQAANQSRMVAGRGELPHIGTVVTRLARLDGPRLPLLLALGWECLLAAAYRARGMLVSLLREMLVARSVERTAGPSRALPDQRSAPGLGALERRAACGPLAAVALADVKGRAATLPCALAMARQVGWTPEGGMNGEANEGRLLKALDISIEFQPAPVPPEVWAGLRASAPVIISTPRHYFVADGYHRRSGWLRVGRTGRAIDGGASWMSVREIERLAGPLDGVFRLVD